MGLFDRFANGRLREDFDALAREVRGLKADHEDLYDRFIRLQGRLARRVRDEREEQLPPGASPDIAPQSAADLQARILARRRGVPISG